MPSLLLPEMSVTWQRNHVWMLFTISYFYLVVIYLRLLLLLKCYQRHFISQKYKCDLSWWNFKLFSTEECQWKEVKSDFPGDVINILKLIIDYWLTWQEDGTSIGLHSIPRYCPFISRKDSRYGYNKRLQK